MIVVMRKKNIGIAVMTVFLFTTLLSFKVSGVLDNAWPVDVKSTSKKVVIDAGHGGEDPGAVSDYSRALEKEINLKISLMVKALFEKEGYEVVLTRKEDQLFYAEGTRGIYNKRRQDLNKRKQIMDSSMADAVVSIHLNKFPQVQYKGAQTFYPADHSESQKLSTIIQKALREFVDPENERQPQAKKNPQEMPLILKNVKVPTSIIECGFLSNEEDEKKLLSEEYQVKIAQAIFSGVDRYIKGDIVPKSSINEVRNIEKFL